jgi:hypothetical protein
MQQSYWQYALIGLVLMGGGPSIALAEEGSPTAKTSTTASVTGGFGHQGRSGVAHGGFGFAAALDRRLGLTPEQKDAVHGLLAQQHQESTALREQTDQKIRALLNNDQQKKFDSMLAEQKARRGHPSARS